MASRNGTGAGNGAASVKAEPLKEWITSQLQAASDLTSWGDQDQGYYRAVLTMLNKLADLGVRFDPNVVLAGQELADFMNLDEGDEL